MHSSSEPVSGKEDVLSKITINEVIDNWYMSRSNNKAKQNDEQRKLRFGQRNQTSFSVRIRVEC